MPLLVFLLTFAAWFLIGGAWASIEAWFNGRR